MRNEDKSFLNDKLKERFKTVQFDVVISNPPYNKGKDLDFVDLGYKLCKKYVVMITPAKWQTAKADQKISSRMKYGQFRKMYVPHMEKVVYYPDCLDVFGIQQSDGITYYLIDKISTYENNCNIINISNLNRYVNSRQTRDITNQQSLWNIGNDLVEALGGGYNTFKFQEISKRKEYTVNINTQMTKATGSSGVWDWDNSCIKPECVGKGGVLFRQDGSLVLTGGTKILLRNQQSSSNKSVDIFTSDSIDECNSFISWFDLKFIRFLALINLSALDIIDNNTFRFVPAPPSGKFEHIYTDEELYKAFNIPQKYIEVIEATIKERKK
jgi:hypothetical protein